MLHVALYSLSIRLTVPFINRGPRESFIFDVLCPDCVRELPYAVWVLCSSNNSGQILYNIHVCMHTHAVRHMHIDLHVRAHTHAHKHVHTHVPPKHLASRIAPKVSVKALRQIFVFAKSVQNLRNHLLLYLLNITCPPAPSFGSWILTERL